MSQDTRSSHELRDDLLSRLDSGGEMRVLLEAFTPLSDSKLTKGFLRLMGVNPDHLTQPLADAHQILDDMTGAILTFAPMGWAPSSQVPADLYAEALKTYRETNSVDDAEKQLVEGWNSGDRLRIAIMRLKNLGAAHEPLQRVFMRRWDFVDRALRHHQSGAYEASVPILFAQADGIVWDLTDPPRGLFTSKGGRSHLVDDGTVAGVPEGLKPLSALFSKATRKSGDTGRLSRHGILHGRELGYDTLTNSTKAFVFLLAVTEWAQPRALDLAERREHEREERHAGSLETDEAGRRLDTRGFKKARDSLRWLGTIEMGQWRNRGRYGADLEKLAPGSLGDNMLHGKGEINLVVTEDGREFRAWRSTPSGLCFGIAGRGGPPNEWRYAGMDPPSSDLDDDEWTGLADDQPPDWY